MTAPGELSGIFGRYQIRSRIGQGGMGTVYLAYDTVLKRRVALKVPTFEDGDEIAVQRFYREAQVAANTEHPHICPVYDIGDINGVHYFTMPFIEGTALAHEIGPDHPWSVDRAAALIAKLALALGEMHQRGVVHRDLKPGNIIMRGNDEPVLLDFGLARDFTAPDRSLSTAGHIAGTPLYMSPEQFYGDSSRVGPSSDLYSLGVLLYELTTGYPPFSGDIHIICAAKCEGRLAPPSAARPDLDAEFDAICLRALAVNPQDRFESMAEFAAALDNYRIGAQPAPSNTVPPQEYEFPPPLPQPSAVGRWVAGILAVALVLTATAAVAYQFINPPQPPPILERTLQVERLNPITGEPGQRLRIPVRVQRAGHNDPVELSLESKAEGVEIRLASIAAGTDAAEVELLIDKLAAAGKHTLRLRAVSGDLSESAVLELTVVPPKVTTRPPGERPGLHGGIEIGGKGVKATVIEVSLNPEGLAVKVGKPLLAKTANTTISRLEKGLYSQVAIDETAEAVGRFYSQMREELGVAAKNVYIVGSSGLPDAPNRPALTDAVHKKTGKQVSYVDQFDEVRLSIMGLVKDDFLGDSIFVDVGSGSTKCGYFEPGNRVAVTRMVVVRTPLIGTVRFTQIVQERLKKMPQLRFPTETTAQTSELFTEPLKEELERRPALVNRKHVFLNGGIVWALATYSWPEKIDEPLVTLRAADIDRFHALLSRTPEQLPEVDLSKITDPEKRKRAQDELNAVANAFTVQNLIAGTDILRGIVKAFRLDQEQKTLYFSRDGLFAWIYAFVKENAGGARKP